MKKVTCVIAVLMTLLVLTSCSSGNVVYNGSPEKSAVTGKSWTVLVYMCGGEEETKYGVSSDKLKQMMNVEYPGNVNVAVQTGGSSSWQTKGIYSDYTQRFDVGSGKMYLADQKMSENMGDYKTLSSFIEWGLGRYKSDNYMLLISGSGGGFMYGMGYDELNGNDSLNAEEISYAISAAGANFDIIALDGSLMGSLETASLLSTCGNYLVAPQNVQRNDSWDYEGFLSYICKKPSAGADEISKVMCDTYYKKCQDIGCEDEATLSAVDMTKISALNQAFDGMTGDMLTATDSLDNYKNLSSAMERIHLYGGATEDEGYSNLADVGDMAVKLKEYVGNTADVLINTLNDTVIYRVCGEKQQNSTGLSVYYPSKTDSEELQNYMEIATSKKYKEFLRKTRIDCSVDDITEDYTSSWAWTSYNNDMQWLEYKSILDENSYQLNILGNMDIIKDVSVNVYKSYDGGYVYIGKHKVSESDWEAGIFSVSSKVETIRFLGKNVTARLVKSGGEYDIYSIPVIINGERGNVRVKYDIEDENYEIIGVWGGIEQETGKALSPMREISFFDRITPILSVYDEEHNQTEYIKGNGSMKLFGGVGEDKISDGDYILEYEITDIYNQKRWGTPVKCKVSGGKYIFG